MFIPIRTKTTVGGQSHPDIEPRIINVNYTDDQAGLPIKEEDTIRARNGVWYTQEECSDFRNKSFFVVLPMEIATVVGWLAQ